MIKQCEKYEQFQILRDIGYVNYLLFSRALALSRPKSGLLKLALGRGRCVHPL